MEAISQELYEQVKTKVLVELEDKKTENRRINLAAEAVFAQATRKYYERVIDKYGRGPSGNARMESATKFRETLKLALELCGYKTARVAYLSGYAEEVNAVAERLLEAILKE